MYLVYKMNTLVPRHNLPGISPPTATCSTWKYILCTVHECEVGSMFPFQLSNLTEIDTEMSVLCKYDRTLSHLSLSLHCKNIQRYTKVSTLYHNYVTGTSVCKLQLLHKNTKILLSSPL